MSDQPAGADQLRQELKRLHQKNQVLKKEVGRLQAVFHNALDCIFIKDSKQTYLQVNKAMELFLGKPAQEIVGKRLDEVVARELTLKSEEEDRRVLAGEVVQNLRHVNFKDGARDFHLIKFPWRDDQGEVAGICGIIRDMTQASQAQKEHQATLKKFHTLFRLIPAAAFFTELESGRYLEVSDSFQEHFGLSPDEAVGKTCLELGHWLRFEEREDVLAELKERGHIRARERSWVSHDGSEHHGLWSAELMDLDGVPCVLSVVMDITDRVKAEKSLRENEAHLRTLVEGSSDAIMTLDAERIITDCNSAFLAQFGFMREEVLGKSVLLIHPDTKSYKDFGVLVYPHIKEHGAWRGEWLYRRKNGELFPMETVLSSLQGPGKKVENYVAVMRDISARKEAERALMASEHRFRELFDNMSSGVAVYQPVEDGGDFVFKDINRAGLALTSVAKEDVIGQLVSQAFPGVKEMGLFEVFQRVCQTGQPEHHPVSLYQDGRIQQWYKNYVYKLPSGELVAIYEDITQRKQDEEDLRWELLVNASLAGLAHELIGQEPDNKAVAQQVLDYAKELTQSQYGYVAYIDPINGDMISYTLSELMETHCGLPADQQSTTFSRNPDGTYPSLWGHSLNTLESFIADDPAKHPAAKGLPKGHIPIDNMLSVPVLFAGDLVGQISLANAPTGYSQHHLRAVEQLAEVYALALHRIQGEDHRRHLESQLRQAHKMEALGALAGGIAHDFNNILAAVLGYAELVANDLPEEHQSQADVANLIKAGQRAKNLVRQILGFSRQTEQELRPMDLSRVLGESMELLRATLPSTISIEQEVDPQKHVVLADPTMVHQVVMNLCSNAAHAMREQGGTLKVSLQRIMLDEADARKFADLRPGAYHTITVSDTGHGIDSETMEHIFEPFFTTKEPGHGTGMGLAVVHGIVKSIHGSIIAESSLGKGSRFLVYLPEMEDEAHEYPRSSLKQIPRGKERILFVDDEEALADLGQRILGHLGYEVRSYTSSSQALEAFKNQPHEYDLVITDQTMPGITGLQLAKEMRTLRPELPIILCTGYSEQISDSSSIENEVSCFLLKPLSSSGLAQTVREVLDEKE
jgi:PAS domain S-box-containing protein